MGIPVVSRIPRCTRKTITFTGAAGLGAQGTVAVATVVGNVLITEGSVHCTVNLAGASATAEIGVAGNTAALVAQTTATDIDAGDYWHDATPVVGIADAIRLKCVTGNLILTVGTADITAGELEITFFWLPLSSDGNLY